MPHCNAANALTSFAPNTARSSVHKCRKMIKRETPHSHGLAAFFTAERKVWALSGLVDFQTQMIGHHGNKFTVGGFASGARNGGAEIFLNGV